LARVFAVDVTVCPQCGGRMRLVKLATTCEEITKALAHAVYVFVRDPAGDWVQQAYVKASNTDAGDYFGAGLALSGDGNTLAVGASSEDSTATGIGGNEGNAFANAGAVYVFVRDGAEAWSQRAYVKASNTGVNDSFGSIVALSEDGNTLAVGAYHEDGNATGIGGNQANDDAEESGAVYFY
jgi:FG-GAP repeat